MAEKVDAIAVTKKTTSVKKAAIASIGKMSYSAMVTKAIAALKEKKGSSRHAIMQYISAEYKAINLIYISVNIILFVKVDPASGKSMMNRTLAKMAKSGRLLPGAQAGRSGAGSYKLSSEEKIAIKRMEKLEAKKQVGSVKKITKTAGEVTAAKKKVFKKSDEKKKVVAKKSGKKVKKVAKAKVGAKVKSGVKVMKKISKANVGVKVKKVSAKPKKAAQKAVVKK